MKLGGDGEYEATAHHPAGSKELRQLRPLVLPGDLGSSSNRFPGTELSGELEHGGTFTPGCSLLPDQVDGLVLIEDAVAGPLFVQELGKEKAARGW